MRLMGTEPPRERAADTPKQTRPLTAEAGLSKAVYGETCGRDVKREAVLPALTRAPWKTSGERRQERNSLSC